MIAARPDLLVIGGLTIDRFADGTSAPGGSVLHIARAAPRGVRVAVITAAGPEPEARAALTELRELTAALVSAHAEATATFSHLDTADGRRLRLELLGGWVQLTGSSLVAGAKAVVVAPVAAEVSTKELSILDSLPFRAAILQGWLRSLDPGAEVRPLPIRALGSNAIAALGGFDLLVASREDLLAESGDPVAQLAALREAVGAGPTLVVTEAAHGLWLDDGTATLHLPVPRLVESDSSVGAGDILAAFLALGDPAVTMELRARYAMRVVAEVLEERRG